MVPAVVASSSTQLAVAEVTPAEDARVVGEPRSAKTALEKCEELLARLAKYRPGPPVLAEADDGRYRDVKTAVATARKLLGMLKKAYEAAPEDGERIARMTIEVCWFIQTAIVSQARGEDRHAWQDIRDELKRFHDRVRGK